MKLSRFCSMVLAAVVFCTAVSQNGVLAYDEMNKTDLFIQSQNYSAETISLAEFNNEDSISAYLSEHNTCSYENDITHMYNGAMKFSSNANGEQSYMRMEGLSIDFSEAEYNEYEYLNFWMYVPENLPVNSDNEPSELSVIFRTAAGTNVRAFYYNLPIVESGWNLVSIPRSSMKNKVASADWENTSKVAELLFYTNTKRGVLPDVKGWPEDGSGYVILDYIYLSKNMPSNTELNFIDTSIENGAENIDEYLGNDKTVEFTANFGLLESSLNTDKCAITENGTVMSEGYSIYVEGDKLKVTFNDKLKAAGRYRITLDEGVVYNQYGMTTNGDTSLEFNIASASSVYRIDQSIPENNAVNVSSDIDGNNTVILTMNNEPGNIDDLKNNIKIIKDKSALSSGYSIDIDEKNIYIKFEGQLDEGAKYTVELPDYAQDIYGNVIDGNRSISFVTEQASESITTILSMGDPSTYSDINFNDMIYKETENVRMYEETLHYTIPAENTADLYVPVTTDMSQYKYLNLWLYSPGISTSGFTITGWDNSGGYFRTHKIVDWSGWQLITLNIADFAMSGSGIPSWKDVNSIGISVNGWTGYIKPWSEESYLCIDNIFLSKTTMDEPQILGVSLPKNYQNASVFDFNVDFVCSNALGYADKSTIKIYDGSGNEINDFDATVNGASLNIRINEQLEYNTTYRIELPGESIYDKTGAQLSQDTTYTFKTMASGASVGIPLFKQENIIYEIPAPGTEITASALVRNNGENSTDVIIMAVQYDIEGNAIDIQKQEKTVTSGEECVDCVFTVKNDTNRIAAFVCDKNMKPLRREAAFLNGENSAARFYSDTQPSVLRIDEAEVSSGEISVTGTYNGTGIILVQVTNSEGEIISLDVLSADKDDRFGAKFNLDKVSEEGEYTITASAFDMPSVSKSVVYLNEETRDNILNEINAAANAKEVAEIVNRYKNVLQINTLPQSRIVNIANTLYEQKTYKTYNQMMVTLNSADALLEQLNKLQWSEMTAFLSTNKTIVMYEESTYQYYNSLNNDKKNEINTAIVKKLPQSDFVSFREVFANAVNSYKNNQSQSSGSSGNSSSGKGTYVGGSSIKAPIDNVINSNNQNVVDNARFNDMDNYSWAKEYVYNLLRRNVISMPEDKNFRPGDNITREEYVKMIVVAFEIPMGEQESKYTDAVSGAWYQQYLAAATEAGIIEGNGNGTFGVGKPITRQDMAVIAYRAVGLTDKKLPVKNEAIAFEDKNLISDYALDAVTEMSAAGIIVGMGNSKFEPRLNAQRAQAAKIISDLTDWRDNI